MLDPDRLTVVAGPKVYSSLRRRFSSLCFGTIKTAQSNTISTEDGGRQLNAGLMRNKESYGARATVFDWYALDPANPMGHAR